MRIVDTLVIHCSATKPDQYIGAAEIDAWHRERGWAGIGYHAVIRRDARLEQGRRPYRMGAHAKGHNRTSIAVCLVGGIDANGNPENNFLPQQFEVLRDFINEAQRWYGPLKIVGHCELPGVNKACPCFDVRDWLENSHA